MDFKRSQAGGRFVVPVMEHGPGRNSRSIEASLSSIPDHVQVDVANDTATLFESRAGV